MAGGALPLGGKFRGERRVAVVDPDHQRDERRHQVAALRLVIAEIRVVHVHEQRDQAGEEQHHKEEKLRLFAEPKGELTERMSLPVTIHETFEPIAWHDCDASRLRGAEP